MSKTLQCLMLLVATLTCCPGRAWADEQGFRIDSPQKAIVLLTNGRQLLGDLVSLNATEVRFKLGGRGNPAVYKSSQVKAVQTETDIYLFNADKGIFESAKALQAQSLAKSPDKDHAEPAHERDGPATQTVVAEGVGTSAEEALKDAFRNAVRQVVGAVVDAETLVKNDELISDKVLTYSDGFIKKYDEVTKKEDKGLFRIKITAEVQRRNVIAKLEAAKVAVKSVDGKGLFAEVVTEVEAKKNAEALLTKALDGFPQNCLKVSVAGEPKLVEKAESKATVQVGIQVEVDHDAYKSLAQRLTPLLEKASSEKGDFVVTFRQGEYYRSPALLADGNRLDDYLKAWMPKALDGLQRADCVALAICQHYTKAGDRLAYRYYVLDKSLHGLLCSLHSANGREGFFRD